MENPSFTEAVSAWLETFGSALREGDIESALSLFGQDCFWRDMVAFTWNIKTAEGRKEIRTMLDATLKNTCPKSWRLEGDAVKMFGAVNAFIIFETEVGRGRGHLRLIENKCFTLLTTLYELKGFEEKVGRNRPSGRELFSQPSNEVKTSNEQVELGLSKQPYVVIVGAGHSGVMLAARLQILKVPTILIEKGALGDSWRQRYDPLHLHTPSKMDAFPYLAYPESWPTYPSKDEIAGWIEGYAQILQLKIWTYSTVQSSHFNEDTKEWTVNIKRSNGGTTILRSKHLVLSTGLYGDPRIPEIDGSDSFKGLQYHATEHRSDRDKIKGRDCIVVGSNTSGHDICQDLWKLGGHVTMIQRSKTLVIGAETLNAVYIDPLFSENSPFTAEQADVLMVSTPYKLLAPFQIPMTQEAAMKDADLHERLCKVGFELSFAEDGSGIIGLLNRTATGYYYNMGGSDLIADGHVALKRGSIARIKDRSIVLSDGSELPADLIVYATGYRPVSETIARVTSPETAEKVGPLWGYGSGLDGDKGPWEGELRNVFKPTAQEGLWFFTGGLVQTRFFSLMVALQLKGRFEGVATPVFG